MFKERVAGHGVVSSVAEVPPDSRRLLLCLNNCRFTSRRVLPRIREALEDIDQLSLDKPFREALGKLFLSTWCFFSQTKSFIYEI